jgi:hypothetical protein
VELSKGRDMVGPGYLRLTCAATKVMDRGEIRVTLAGFNGLTAWIGKQIGLAGLAKTAGRIDGQIGLAVLATRSRKQEVPVSC